jgi:hypothetical protein
MRPETAAVSKYPTVSRSRPARQGGQVHHKILNLIEKMDILGV